MFVLIMAPKEAGECGRQGEKGREPKAITKNLGSYLKQGGQSTRGFQEKDDASYTVKR